MLIALVAVTTVIVRTVRDDPELDMREGSELVRSRGAPLDPGATGPTAYRIVYRIENRAGGELVLRTEEAIVRRPFDGRVEERPDAPPGDHTAATTTVSVFGALGVESASASPVVLNIPANPAVADVRPLAALERARTRGLVELRERRRLTRLDRECQVYRLGGPIGGGALTPAGTPAGEYVDVCVDRWGFVLEEVEVVDGDRILRRRLAVELDVDPAVPTNAFALPDADPPPVDQGGGSVREVEPTTRPPGDEFFELTGGAPAGFRHRGRYAVVPPQAREFADPLLRSQRVAGVIDVWESGPDFVAVDQGGTLGGVEPFEPEPDAEIVDAGPLGPAEVVLGLRASEIRAQRDGGRYVRIYGTVPPERLLEVARDLEPRTGGELVYLDGPGT
ncbi:MAG: hypothetical protein HYU28_09480 [Actinobacteria bacterium]|nr:hypothetical protein [Actinomycetota bacterium]